MNTIELFLDEQQAIDQTPSGRVNRIFIERGTVIDTFVQ